MEISHLHQLFIQSNGICTDTRKLKKGDIYFALKGPSFNGNDFALKALNAGAVYAVIDESLESKDQRLIHVDDALQALQQLARIHRRKLNIPILAITGSNGKTTNKELIAAVLSKKYKTHYTSGNLNNHIGVPLTLLSLNDEHEVAVVEMGANHIGEIAELCSIAEPDHALITSIGVAHLEGFGSMKGIRNGKKELFDYMVQTGGRSFINVSEPEVASLYEGSSDNAFIFGDEAHLPYWEITTLNPFVQQMVHSIELRAPSLRCDQ